ncbi:MAG: zinc-binding dehydrogenase [Saprospiraceae bacterium]
MHPVLDCTFPLEEVAQAHRYMEENRNTGKIALLL